MQEPTPYSKFYTGGYHAFKRILRLGDEGQKIISHEGTGWKHFSDDYISSAYVNSNGTKVAYCIPLDIDAKDTDDKWLDAEGVIDWEKSLAFLQEKYPKIFQYTLFVVRSTGGKGMHIGLAISPIVKDRKAGSDKTLFLAKQAQIALIRLLKHHGFGADMSAVGVIRDLPNWRRNKESEFSKACQLYFNRMIQAKIKRKGLSVITEILAITNKLKECRVLAKKEREEILHPHKTTEARLAPLYVELFDEMGNTNCYTMKELMDLTKISRATLRNILVKRPKSRPKWLNVNYISKTEGYELWIDPEFGDVNRAVELIENPEYHSTFMRDLPPAAKVEKGNRNAWLASAAIYLKWYGHSKHKAMIALDSLSQDIPDWEESRSCKNIPQIVESIYRNEPHLFGIRGDQELPVVLREKQDVKKKIEGPLGVTMGLVSLGFTRRSNEKYAVAYLDNKILSVSKVAGNGYKFQLRAIQDILHKIDKKPEKIEVRGKCMLKDNPVAVKFARYHGFSFEYAERSKEDKKLLCEFRTEESKKLPSKHKCVQTIDIVSKNKFQFPDFEQKVVRCDGYVSYRSCFYWLGESWIGRKIQLLDDGTNVEFFLKAQLVRSYERLRGKGTKTESPSKRLWHKAKSLDSTYRRKAQKVGPEFDRIILAQIDEGEGLIDTKKIFSFLGLIDNWPYEQLEAVATHCVKRHNFTNRYFRSCLEAGVE